MITHVSFDVWNTLVTANSEFAEARTKFLAARYGVDPEQMKHEYTTLKRHADYAAENNGRALATFALTRILIGSVTVGEPSEAETREVMGEIADMFIAHPPIMQDSTIQLLNELVERDITEAVS